MFRHLGSVSKFAFSFTLLVSVSMPIMPSQNQNSDHTEWLADSLREIQSIKIGMTRRELLKVFVTEGGLYSRSFRKYAYRGSPLIKVDVEFKSVGAEDKGREHPEDRIIKISRPYLEGPILD